MWSAVINKCEGFSWSYLIGNQLVPPSEVLSETLHKGLSPELPKHFWRYQQMNCNWFLILLKGERATAYPHSWIHLLCPLLLLIIHLFWWTLVIKVFYLCLALVLTERFCSSLDVTSHRWCTWGWSVGWLVGWFLVYLLITKRLDEVAE